jgi:hypothetical protein
MREYYSIYDTAWAIVSIVDSPEISQDTNTDLPFAVRRAAEYITRDIETYESFFEQRLAVEESLSRQYRLVNDNLWGYGDGLYRSYSQEPEGTERGMGAPLSGLEKLWAQRIDECLLKKRGTGEPVTLMDFGGGFGVSLMRVGANERYREAVEKGDLILIATNLGYLPSEEADEDGYTSVAKSINARNKEDRNVLMDADELRFIQENQHRVHFLDANIPELQRASVQIDDGATLPLMGNIDILSEETALAHSHIPDIGLWTFSQMLREDGTLFLSTKQSNFLQRPAEKFRHIETADGQTIDAGAGGDYHNQRRAAFDAGMAAMHESGLGFVDDDPLGVATLRKV